jgi:hypothetical protein
MTNPLFEAIERLTNPYALQERVYRNRVDEHAHLDDLLIARVDDTHRMATLEARYGVTWFPLDKDDPYLSQQESTLVTCSWAGHGASYGFKGDAPAHEQTANCSFPTLVTQ